MGYAACENVNEAMEAGLPPNASDVEECEAWKQEIKDIICWVYIPMLPRFPPPRPPLPDYFGRFRGDPNPQPSFPRFRGDPNPQPNFPRFRGDPSPEPNFPRFRGDPSPEPSFAENRFQEFLLGEFFLDKLKQNSTPNSTFFSQIKESGIQVEVVKDLLQQFEEAAKYLKNELSELERGMNKGKT